MRLSYRPMVNQRCYEAPMLCKNGLLTIFYSMCLILNEARRYIVRLRLTTPLLPTQMSGLLFPTGFCPDIGSHTVHPASARCPEPRLFGGRDGGLWEWPDLSCHSLVGSFKIEFFFFCLKVSSSLSLFPRPLPAGSILRSVACLATTRINLYNIPANRLRDKYSACSLHYLLFSSLLSGMSSRRKNSNKLVIISHMVLCSRVSS
jgi:hypothetical protein